LREFDDQDFLWLFLDHAADYWETRRDASNTFEAKDDHIISVGHISDCESGPYIVPHGVWKKHGDPDAKNGEYRFVQYGHRVAHTWRSIRHYVGCQVVQLEVEAALNASKEPELQALDLYDFDRTLDNGRYFNFYGYAREAVNQRDPSWIDEYIRVLREVERNWQRGILPTISLEGGAEEAGATLPQNRKAQKPDDPLMLSDNMWDCFAKRIPMYWQAGRQNRDYRGVIKNPDDAEAAGRLVEMFKAAWRERLEARGKNRRQ